MDGEMGGRVEEQTGVKPPRQSPGVDLTYVPTNIGNA